MKYEEDIRNGLKALLAEADAKTKELNAELKEQKKNAPEAGTSEFLDYEKSCRLLKAQYKLALGKLQFMDDQDKYLAAMRKKRWENRQHGSTAAFFEEYHSQLRYAEELTKLLCALVNEAVALEYGLAVGHDKIRKEGRLKDVTARLGRFEAAIGGNAAARLGLYYDTIANPPPKAVVPEAGSGDEASGDIEEADIAEPQPGQVMVAVKTEGAQNRADHKDVIKIEGNLKEDGASVEQHVTGDPEVRARLKRENELRTLYAFHFAEAAAGQLVELPEDCRPVPGDTIKVVGVPDGDPYKGKIAIWRGPRSFIHFVGMEKAKFKMGVLRVVLQK